MYLIIMALEILLAGAAGALLARGRRGLVLALGCGSAVAGCAVGLAGALGVLLGGPVVEEFRLAALPMASFSPQADALANWAINSTLKADALAAWFLVPVFALGMLAALYGGQYLAGGHGAKSNSGAWFFYNLLVIAMALVILARGVVLFLVAWEVMALASFFLVTHEDERPSVQRAGWIYLVATHLGTAALLAMFLLLGRGAGSLDFNAIAESPARGPGAAGLIFVLALLGFGAKAGIAPLHVWLPEAHPAAPSHVSALMSGVMIKTGIYGMMRVLTWLAPPQAPAPGWWAWTLLAIGAVSGIGGVLLALVQHDLKRLLAYSSVENIGIIFLGLGLGVLGSNVGSPTLAALGYGAALLHTLNHSLFKGMLFMGAGSVLHGAHTLAPDALGGLLRRMPWTGACFLAGSAAICGLPPFNGFVSEFLIYYASFGSFRNLAPQAAAAALLPIAALALIGGLAVACFTKAFGIVFSGEPRTPEAAAAHESGWAMRIGMAVPAAACLGLGLGAPWVLRALQSPLEVATGHTATGFITDPLAEALRAAGFIGAGGAGLIAIAAGLALLRRKLLGGRTIGAAGTWDCGYARPTARMQYTASSFVQPLTGLFASLLRTHRRDAPPQGYFPQRASLHTHTPDAMTDCVFTPVFKFSGWALSKLRRLQTGSVHLYILYIALTLIVLLVWKLR